MKKLLVSLAVALCACWTAYAQNFNEAKSLYAAGDYDKAKAAFAKLLKASPSSAAYNYWYGVACMQTGDYELAKKSLEKSAKRKYADSYFVLGRLNTILYDFDAAVSDFESYSSQISKQKEGEAEARRCDKALGEARAAQMMMRGVEKVNVIDSVVMDKRDFLSIYRLGKGAGTLQDYAGFFSVEADSADERTVYRTELGNVIYYSDKRGDSLSLYKSQRDGAGWTQGTLLPEPVTADGSQSYPYLLSDGLTIYYASTAEGGIGGYDIYVTTYNTDNDTYMQPQNVGMPFNSPFNDYMYVIDEQNDLGWFASDRYQPEGKVCVYVFVPNDTKLVYDPSELEPASLRQAASLKAFHDTQPSEQVVADGLQRLKAVLAASDTAERGVDFVFVIDDARTYTSIYDFMSKEAQDLFVKRNKQIDACDEMEGKLDDMRARYHSASAEGREKMRPAIVDLERRVEQMQLEIDSLAVQVRNAEIKKIKEMNL